MFIGECPGENEDEQGQPFVGRAGQLFDKFMRDPGFDSFYVTNAVMCKPPGSDKPKAEHWNACRPRLLREIAAIDPVVVVTLGGIAANALLGDSSSILKLRERFHSVEIEGTVTTFTKPVICTYHPSAAQREGSLGPGSILEKMYDDLCKVREIAWLWSSFARRK